MLPCLCHVSEPGACKDGEKQYNHISLLQRHLQSYQHQFYACERCLTIFPNSAELSDHKDGPDICVKVCRNARCRRRVPRDSVHLERACNCLNTAEDQWRALYTLKYGVPAPAVFRDEGNRVGHNVVDLTTSFHAGDSSDDDFADENVRCNVSTPQESDPGVNVQLADLLQKLEDERKGREVERKRREEVADCLGVVWEMYHSSNDLRSHGPFLERWVERLLGQEAPSNAGRPHGHAQTREISAIVLADKLKKRAAGQSSPGAKSVRPQESTRSKRRRDADNARKTQPLSSRPIDGALVSRNDQQIQPFSSEAVDGASVQEVQSTPATRTLRAVAHPDQLELAASSSWKAPGLSDLDTVDFDASLFDIWTGNVPNIDWTSGVNSFRSPTTQPENGQT